MSALYIMRYHGQQDQGMGAIYIGKGTIVGVDIGGGRYHGTFQDQGGRLRATVNLSMPQGGTLVTGQQLQPGASVPITADWPSNFANGQAQQVSVGGRLVQVTFEKVGDVP